MEFVPNHAPFVVMAFLLTGLGLALTGVGFLYGLGAKQWLVVRLGLLVADEDLLSSLLIGHENSPFHKKVLFRLPARS